MADKGNKVSLLEQTFMRKRRDLVGFRDTHIVRVGGLVLCTLLMLMWLSFMSRTGSEIYIKSEESGMEAEFPLPSEEVHLQAGDTWSTDLQSVISAQDANKALERFEPESLQNRFRVGRHLIVSYYNGNYSEARLNEVNQVLLNNIQNELIERVHIFLEEKMPKDVLAQLEPYMEKIVFVPIGFGQPTYRMFFAYANTVLERGTIGMISNSDITFGSTLSCAQPVTAANTVVFNQTERRLILALSRHPSPCGTIARPQNECLRYRGSHDAFLFAPPLDWGTIERLDFFQNRLGAENRLLFELRNNINYRVSNPCHTIKIFHHHCAKNSRNIPPLRLAKKGDGQYASVDPISRYRCGDVIY